jgi:FkbM family methyltransferase
MLLENNHLIIVDIGASGGIDSRWKSVTPYFKGILFEPDAREYDTLKENSESNLIVLNSALSDSRKKVEFNLCKKQMVSSIYRPNFNFLEKFTDVERFKVEKTIKLDADTLDNQLKINNINEVDFIKIDTQGYELPILKGYENNFDSVIGLEIEVEFEPMYEGQPLFSDVDNFVKDKGFSLIDLKRYYWKRKGNVNTGNNKGQMIFGDALYFKSPEQILLMTGITQEKIIRCIFIYLAYGYIDLSQTLLKSATSKGLLSEESCDLLVIKLKKYENKNLFKGFKIRRKIAKLFCKLSNKIDPGEDYSGTDSLIGNL